MPDLQTIQAATPKCPECHQAMRWNDNAEWWWCKTCKQHHRDAGHKYGEAA